jgi:hypothetical protein
MERATGFEPATFSLAKPPDLFRHVMSGFVGMAPTGQLEAFYVGFVFRRACSR